MNGERDGGSFSFEDDGLRIIVTDGLVIVALGGGGGGGGGIDEAAIQFVQHGIAILLK